MKVQKELINHIEAENAKTKAWIAEDPSNRGAGLYPTDVRYWEDRGIFTMAQLEREDLITYIYDGHKDAYGFRNRGYDFDSMTLDELKAEADSISKAVAEEMERMDSMDQSNIAKFEALVTKYIPMSGSRDRAIHWILESENLLNEGDVGYVQYTLGLPYSYKTEEILNVLKKAS
jgi:hypothetical protein